MRVLRAGCSGDDVTRWQQFLTGQSLLHDVVSGVYDEATVQATRDFQRLNALDVDGTAGTFTQGKAMTQGFAVLTDDESEDGPGWPSKPDVSPLCLADRKRIFGQFPYVPAPTASCPEGIRFADNWPSENIVTVEVPQLIGVQGATGKVQFHKLAAPQLVALFQAWEAAGLMPLVKSWAGSWAPRFIRGSRTYLSNHAWATAFDINAAWNGLGMQPALKGKTGSVRELVALALDHGFYWGGWFGTPFTPNGRSDGMHFEVCALQ